MNQKEQIRQSYDELAGILGGLSIQIARLKFHNPKLEEARANMAKLTEKEAGIIRKEAMDQLDAVVWDKLVIAFFGETNAGKSTIIESLRILLNEESREKERNKFSLRKLFRKGSFIPTDGLIVGDGRQDFTKDYHEYNMTVNGHPFVLIDVPGIEGNESAYTEGISQALGKGHCVFYVHGGGIPNEATAKKIIKYLNEWIKVRVINNVRDNVEAYEFPEDRVSLLTPQVRKSQEVVDRSFKNYLGEHFEGVISVQGLLAMSSHADFSSKRPDLIKVKQRLLSEFGEGCGDVGEAADKIREFSHIMELVTLIEQKSTNFTEEIRMANMLKLSTFGRRIYKTVRDHINEEGAKFNNYSRIIKNFQSENESAVDDAAQMFQRTVSVRYKQMLETLRKDGYDKIERSAFGGLDSLLEAYRGEFKAMLKEEIDKTKAKFIKDINTSAGRLTEIPGVSVGMIGNISLGNINIPLPDTGAISDADDISFGDVVKSVGSTVGGATTGAVVGGAICSFIPFVGTALGAWIGGAIGGGAGLVGGNVSAAEEQTRRAKKVFDEQLEKQRQAAEKVCQDGCNKVISKLSSEINIINNRTQTVYNDIMKYLNCLNEATGKINNFITKVSR